MYVESDRQVIKAAAGDTEAIVLRVTNTSDVIDHYRVRALGLDHQRHVRTEPPDGLALFPGDAGEISVLLTVPIGRPAQNTSAVADPTHRIGLEVSSSSKRPDKPPEITIVDVDVQVTRSPGLRIDITPDLVTMGQQATFAVELTNTGNDDSFLDLDAIEGEDHLELQLTPDRLALPTGQSEFAFMSARGRRKLVGTPTPRQVTVTAIDERFPDERIETVVTIMQRAWIPRVGILVFAIAVLFGAWAVLISAGLDSVANSVDHRIDNVELDLQDAERAASEQIQALRGDPTAGSVDGRVLARTTNSPIAGATVTALLVELAADDAADALQPGGEGGRATTDDSGAFDIEGLPAGTYRFVVDADGYLQPPSTAPEVAILAGLPSVIDVRLDGRAGSISGMVVEPGPGGTDVPAAGAVVRLVAVADDRSEPAEPRTTVDAQGAFTVTNIATPGDYEILVDKGEGDAYRQAVVRVPVSASEPVVLSDPVLLQTRTGNVSGTINAASGGGASPLGGAVVTLTSTDATTIYQTHTLTAEGAVGEFSLTALRTPETYTVNVTASGYQSESTTVTVAVDADPPPVELTLAPTAGSITGTVRTPDRSGALVGLGGVSILARGASPGTDGTFFTVSTVSLTADLGDVGRFRLDSLPVPGVYVLDFSLEGYAPKSLEVILPATGTVPQSITLDPAVPLPPLPPPTGSLTGSVRDVVGAPLPDLALTLSHVDDPTVVRTVITVSDPSGSFEIDGLPPGTYAVSVPDLAFEISGSSSVDVAADSVATIDVALRSVDQSFVVLALSGAERGAFRELRVLDPVGGLPLFEQRFDGPPPAEFAQIVVGGLGFGRLVVIEALDSNRAVLARELAILAGQMTFPRIP